MSSETKHRWITALALGLFCLAFVFYLPMFVVLLFVFACAILYELAPHINERFEDKPFVGTMVFIAVVAYVLLGVMSAFLVRRESLALFFLLVFGTMFSDIFAYFGGRKFGRIHFLPKISPNKTLEGVICAFLATFLFVWGFNTFIYWYSTILQGYLIVPVLIFISAVLGDLIESIFKRKLGIKDASAALGSHGGFSDRLDSHLLVFQVLFLFFYLTHYISL